TSAVDGLRKTPGISRIYRQTIGEADAVFARGVMIPAVPAIYQSCAQRSIPLVHWLVGNPEALLRSHRRYGPILDHLGRLFVRRWEGQVRRGYRQGGPACLLCNGQEIADRFGDGPTEVTVSTTLRPEDIQAPRADRAPSASPAPLRILTVAYIRPEKGIEYLLEAMSLLKTQGEVHLDLVGSRDRYPTYQAKLDQLIRQHGLEERIHWRGHTDRDDLATHFGRADLFVLPTLSEGTPRVLLEAMAHGVPLVASQVGGIPDSVAHEVNGLLIPPKDPAALAEACDRVFADSQLRQGLVESGREFARAHTVDRFAERIVSIFRRLTER
nr:glycosyltransferase family 4 protein [Candidatus Krumholzibacteria bacterium]